MTRSETADDASASIDRPPFRGCVVCYAVEMTYYAIRKVAGRLRPTHSSQ